MEENDNILKKKEVIANLNIELSKNLPQNERILQIEYYENMQLLSESMAEYGFEEDICTVTRERINDKGESEVTYELYDSNNNNIGKVVKGKVHFNREYLESIKEICKDNSSLYDELVELDGKIDYKELLEKNKDKSLVMTEKEIDEYIRDERTKEQQREENSENREINEEEQEKQKEENQEEKEQLEKEQEPEGKGNKSSLTERIAEEKGIPSHSVVFVKENSSLYKDHPELERNMYFYRDKDGVVKAEYIDKNGKPQPSKYINDSKTLSRQVVSIGKDGSEVEREVPYQFMTSSIGQKGAIKEVGFSVNINMGYLEIEEARLGTNGKWTSHEVEMQGRDYNSSEVREQTELIHGSKNPNRISNAYERVEDTGFEENGIQLDELSLRRNVEKFIDEGYQRPEAIDIVNYMIGEEALTEEQAKERVNDEIKQRGQEDRQNESQQQESSREDDEEEQRTMGGDAWDRLMNRR